MELEAIEKERKKSQNNNNNKEWSEKKNVAIIY